MRKSLILLAALAASSVALAADPTLPEVYQAADSGHLAQAQQMMTQVLKDHPRSGKAHYVAAEIFAREGNYDSARQELSAAETLEPGLAFAKPASVSELQAQISQSRPSRPLATYPVNSAAPARGAFPLGTILILVGALAVVWFMFRRRSSAVGYPVGPSAVGPQGYGSGYGPGYGPGPMGGGIGSGIAGGLATGLAVGAGVVAGEELAHHFLDSDGRPVAGPPQGEGSDPHQNGDMGGSNFGVSDGNSWDDGSSNSFGVDNSGGDGGWGDSGGGDGGGWA